MWIVKKLRVHFRIDRVGGEMMSARVDMLGLLTPNKLHDDLMLFERRLAVRRIRGSGNGVEINGIVISDRSGSVDDTGRRASGIVMHGMRPMAKGSREDHGASGNRGNKMHHVLRDSIVAPGLDWDEEGVGRGWNERHRLVQVGLERMSGMNGRVQWMAGWRGVSHGRWMRRGQYIHVWEMLLG